MQFSSKLIEDAVRSLSRLPGIGEKTALRLVLHLLKEEEEVTKDISQSLSGMREGIRYCIQCHFLATEELCEICSNSSRRTEKICVVESIRDVLALENTGEYYGRYHVLGGLIAPLKGVGPDDIKVDDLIVKLQKDDIKELIFVLSPTVEGDTTAYYISQKIPKHIKVSTIARGISFGGELEYADELTLARSLANRLPFDNYINED